MDNDQTQSFEMNLCYFCEKDIPEGTYNKCPNCGHEFGLEIISLGPEESNLKQEKEEILDTPEAIHSYEWNHLFREEDKIKYPEMEELITKSMHKANNINNLYIEHLFYLKPFRWWRSKWNNHLFVVGHNIKSNLFAFRYHMYITNCCLICMPISSKVEDYDNKELRLPFSLYPYNAINPIPKISMYKSTVFSTPKIQSATFSIPGRLDLKITLDNKKYEDSVRFLFRLMDEIYNFRQRLHDRLKAANL